MQHIITDEEAERYLEVFNAHHGTLRSCRKAALTDFLNNRPQVAQLRPIAEMPEAVPEGCERFYTSFGAYEEGKWASLTRYQGVKDTYSIDIQLPTPDPEAEERRRFEESYKAAFPNASIARNDGPYYSEAAEYSFQGWMLAKKGGDK